MQRVAFFNKIEGFVRLNHKLFVRPCQVLGLDDDYFLLLELDVAAGCNDDPVLARVMLFASLFGLC